VKQKDPEGRGSEMNSSRRETPTTEKVLTTDEVRDYVVLRLTKLNVFEIEIWGKRPIRFPDASLFEYLLDASSTRHAVGELRTLMRKLTGQFADAIIGLRDIAHDSIYGMINSEAEKLILWSTKARVAIQPTNSRSDILNATAELPTSPSYVWLRSADSGAMEVEVFHLLATSAAGLGEHFGGFSAEQVLRRHSGPTCPAVVFDPENLGGFIPEMGRLICPGKVPEVRVADLSVTRNDPLLAQLTEELWRDAA